MPDYGEGQEYGPPKQWSLIHQAGRRACRSHPLREHGTPLTESLSGAAGVAPLEETIAPIFTVFWLLAIRLSHVLLAATAPLTVPPEKLVTSKFQLLTSVSQPGLPKEMV